MKKLLLIVVLLPVMAVGQSNVTLEFTPGNQIKIQSFGDDIWQYPKPNIFDEWKEYLVDCNELVPDTIIQTGTVRCELVPVKMNGKIVSYNTVPIDTLWDDSDCNEFKYGDDGFRYTGISWISGSGLTLTQSNSRYSKPESAKNIFSIKREKICMIKKRKSNFEDFFTRWCVEKKLIELN